jgi:hypothetical protein
LKELRGLKRLRLVEGVEEVKGVEGDPSLCSG